MLPSTQESRLIGTTFGKGLQSSKLDQPYRTRSLHHPSPVCDLSEITKHSLSFLPYFMCEIILFTLALLFGHTAEEHTLFPKLPNKLASTTYRMVSKSVYSLRPPKSWENCKTNQPAYMATNLEACHQNNLKHHSVFSPCHCLKAPGYA